MKNKEAQQEEKSFYAYSPSTNAFYHSTMLVDYRKAGTLPDDALAVDDAIYNEYAAGPAPAGKIRVAGADGLPEWGITPKPEPKAALANNTQKLKELINAAVSQITILQSAIACGRAKASDPADLKAYQEYLCDLREMTTEQLLAAPAQFPASPADGGKN